MSTKSGVFAAMFNLLFSFGETEPDFILSLFLFLFDIFSHTFSKVISV